MISNRMSLQPCHPVLFALALGLVIPGCGHNGNGDPRNFTARDAAADGGLRDGDAAAAGLDASFGCVPGGCAKGEYCNTKTRRCAPADVSECDGVCPPPAPADAGPVPTSCTALGCLDAGVCDPDSGLCYPPAPNLFDCTKSGCGLQEICVTASRQCREETCSDTGCELGFLCNTKSGQCEPDSCLRTGCDPDQDCNPKTGNCEPAQPDPPGPCDPLDSGACEATQGCVFTGEQFQCIALRVLGPTGSACGGDNECAPGNTCAPQGIAPGCGGDSCCAAYCDAKSKTPCAPAKTCKLSPDLPGKDIGVCAYEALVSCDPLSADPCPKAQACSWTPEVFTFVCFTPDAPGNMGDVCNGPNTCAPGLACIAPTPGAQCQGSHCCAQLCEKNGTDCDPTSQCVDVPAWADLLPEAGVCEALVLPRTPSEFP